MGVLRRLHRDSTGVDAPRVDIPGVDVLRALAVAAVLYCHISYYVIDTRGEGWIVVDVVYAAAVRGASLNQHLTFLGVAIFMMITGLLVTRSAIRNEPARFLIMRIGRLLPAMWVAVFIAILLVRLGINGMFTRQDGISNLEAVLSFFLGGFFLKPEVSVLQVTWTLVAQVVFYVFCVACRPLLRTVPVAVPVLGALFCEALLLYNRFVPAEATVPMFSKIAATLPAIFLGQLLYLLWAGLASWPWILVGAVAQFEVLTDTQEAHAYGIDQHYVRTMVVVALLVVAFAKLSGPVARSSVLHWIGTRSYAIYLLHTLILYRVFDYTIAAVGTTGSVVIFLIVTGLAAEALYRWVEVPGERFITRRLAKRDERRARVNSEHAVVRGNSGTREPEVDNGGARSSAVGTDGTTPAS